MVDRLKVAFLNSEKLQQHARFLFAKGSIYKTCNGNLLYHGCIPMNDDGSFKSLKLDHATSAGKDLMDKFTRLARQGFFTTDESTEETARVGRHVVLVVRPLFASFWQGKDDDF